MTTRRLAALCLVLSLSSVSLPAQDAAPPPQPKAESVLEHIPAGAMGFVAANNIQGMLDGVEKLMKELGLSEQIGLQQPGMLLAMLRQQGQLGAGFNPNGGAAAVMLDPQQFNIDLLAMAGMGGQPPAEGAKVPFVLMLAGSGVKEVFDKYEIEEQGEFSLVKLRMGPMTAKKAGGYILLSPDAKFITALLEAKEKIAAAMSPGEAKSVAAADVALHINMKVAGPLLNKLLTNVRAMMEMAAQGEPLAKDIVKMYLDMYGKAIAQMQSLTFALRLAPAGVVIEELVSFLPDSEYGKMMAMYGSGQPLLNRLPNLPYVLAMGAQMGSEQGRAEAIKVTNDLLDKLLASEVGQKIPATAQTKIKSAMTTGLEQIQGVQVVAGPAPEGAGVIGLAGICQVKDADAYRQAIADGISAVMETVKALSSPTDDIKDLKITYTKGAETVAGVSVDTIVISHPEMDKMSPNDKAEMTKALGEDQIRIFIAAKDKNTVVMTFGGGKTMLAEALKTADGTGTIPSSPGLDVVKQIMPEKGSFLMVFNLANLMAAIEKGAKIMGEEAPPFKVTAKTPIAIGGGIQGATAHVVIFVPTDVIKDVTGLVMREVMGGGAEPGAAKKPAGANDF